MLCGQSSSLPDHGRVDVLQILGGGSVHHDLKLFGHGFKDISYSGCAFFLQRLHQRAPHRHGIRAKGQQRRQRPADLQSAIQRTAMRFDTLCVRLGPDLANARKSSPQALSVHKNGVRNIKTQGFKTSEKKIGIYLQSLYHVLY